MNNLASVSSQSTQAPIASSMLQKLRHKHDRVYVIVSPPRCSSTAFARVFWEHPAIGYYSHEPFETVYYERQGLTAVSKKLSLPLDLKTIQNQSVGNHLVIKEMPYQVGRHFPLLAAMAHKPLIFLIRDPRLNIASRMAQKTAVGDSPFFPLQETGWNLLVSQISYCQVQQIPHIIVDAADFRNQPHAIFSQIFAQYGLAFSEKMLTWQPRPDVNLDNLGGHHQHLYERVLHSRALLPAQEPIPPLESFPQKNNLRDHVRQCLHLYEMLRQSPVRIRPNHLTIGEG